MGWNEGQEWKNIYDKAIFSSFFYQVDVLLSLQLALDRAVSHVCVLLWCIRQFRYWPKCKFSKHDAHHWFPFKQCMTGVVQRTNTVLCDKCIEWFKKSSAFHCCSKKSLCYIVLDEQPPQKVKHGPEKNIWVTILSENTYRPNSGGTMWEGGFKNIYELIKWSWM